MVYLLVVGSFIGYISYTYALKHLPISTVSLYAYVNPVIAVVLGAMILKEPFTRANGRRDRDYFCGDVDCAAGIWPNAR